jgi:hypothetical protein
MEAPKVTDWIQAFAGVAQTVGALSAIIVTAIIARRSERNAADRERESVARENAARKAADDRAEAAIEHAAWREERRAIAERARIARMAQGIINTVVGDLDGQLKQIERLPAVDDYGETSTYRIDWEAAEAAVGTFKVMLDRSSDVMLASLLEQTIAYMQRPGTGGFWTLQGAKEVLTSRRTSLASLVDTLDYADDSKPPPHRDQTSGEGN